jgi:hypothetical protein
MALYYSMSDVALLGWQLCAAGWAKPDRGRRVWLSGRDGASHLQFCRRRLNSRRPLAPRNRSTDMEAGCRAALAWVADPVQQRERVEAAEAFAAAHRGACERTVRAIQALMAKAD